MSTPNYGETLSYLRHMNEHAEELQALMEYTLDSFISNQDPKETLAFHQATKGLMASLKAFQDYMESPLTLQGPYATLA